jgi:hypothetical protein
MGVHMRNGTRKSRSPPLFAWFISVTVGSPRLWGLSLLLAGLGNLSHSLEDL